MSYQILERESTILFFEKEGTINPSSTMQIMRVGNRAMIHSLIGEGFYRILTSVGIEPFRKMGVDFVYAAISPAHYRLLKNNMPEGVQLTLEGECMINGYKFKWVKIHE